MKKLCYATCNRTISKPNRTKHIKYIDDKTTQKLQAFALQCFLHLRTLRYEVFITRIVSKTRLQFAKLMVNEMMKFWKALQFQSSCNKRKKARVSYFSGTNLRSATFAFTSARWVLFAMGNTLFSVVPRWRTREVLDSDYPIRNSHVTSSPAGCVTNTAGSVNSRSLVLVLLCTGSSLSSLGNFTGRSLGIVYLVCFVKRSSSYAFLCFYFSILANQNFSG